MPKTKMTWATIWAFASTASNLTAVGGRSHGPYWSMDGKVAKWNLWFHGTHLHLDPVTNFPDAIRLRNKTASLVGMQFENLWLSRYPRPVRCVHDLGTKFMGADFQGILWRFGIKDVTISVRNPQSNAIYEWLHQSFGDALWVSLSQDIPFISTTLLNSLLAQFPQRSMPLRQPSIEHWTCLPEA
jgi:transposase InsO family protein